MYKYFVSYSYSFGGTLGFGNSESNVSFEIKRIQDVVNISRSIEKDLGYPANSLVILNYQLIESSV